MVRRATLRPPGPPAPLGRFPYARLRVSVAAAARRPGLFSPGARVEVGRAGWRHTLLDLMPGEAGTVWCSPGPVRLTVSAGPEWAPQQHTLTVLPGEQRWLPLRLAPALEPEPGWVAGDHHMHSYYEDGAQSPKKVLRAAAADGLQYVFVTDEPEPLLPHLERWRQPGRFLPLPGQEVVNPEVHCNALNARRRIECPAYGQAADAYTGPAQWLADTGQATPGHPTALMLNHPLHRPEVAARHPHFRSGWVADQFPAIKLVENFDFPSWFQRLDAGRRLVGLWTTDTHDVVFIPPGARRTYVYVGETFDEHTLLAALLAGRCFNARHPGALLYLRVDGQLPGATVPAGPVTVQLSCQPSAPSSTWR